jgi:hypothetical protein
MTLSYHDLEDLCNSFDYFEKSRKTVFIMIAQVGPLTLFVTLYIH